MSELKSITPKGLESFKEFWPYYVMEHELNVNRYLHVVGTTMLFLIILAAIYFSNPFLLLLLPLVGYGFAWLGHFIFQKNRPATFTYPLWSLIGDFKMFFLSVAGQMPSEIKKAKEIVKS